VISISFSNLDELYRVYDPQLVDRAASDATWRLRTPVKNAVAKSIAQTYNITQGGVNQALRVARRKRESHETLLIYQSKRPSLPRFSSKRTPTRGNRPKVKTRRGTRYGAKARIVKSRGQRLIQGAFWGRGRAGTSEEGRGAGAWLIWIRTGRARSDIKKLTGPSVSQLVSTRSARAAADRVMESKSDEILKQRLDFYLGRRAGVL